MSREYVPTSKRDAQNGELRYEILRQARADASSTPVPVRSLLNYVRSLLVELNLVAPLDPIREVERDDAERVNSLITDMRARGVCGSWSELAEVILQSDEFQIKPHYDLYKQARLTNTYPKVTSLLRNGDFNSAYEVAVRAQRRLPFALEAFKGVVADEVDTLAAAQHKTVISTLMLDAHQPIVRAGAGMFIAIVKNLHDDAARSEFVTMLVGKIEHARYDGVLVKTLRDFIHDFNEGTQYKYAESFRAFLESSAPR